MSDGDFPGRITLCEDGVYRWAYDLDMYSNHFLRNFLLKLIGAICLVTYVFLLLLVAQHSGFTLGRIILLALPFAAALLLTLVIYSICAAVMHGVYRLRFEMDEEGIRLAHRPTTQKMMDAMADAAVTLGSRTGSAMRTAAANGATRFADIWGVGEHPDAGVLNLRLIFGMNQIFIPREDYEFVRAFILERVPERARQGLPAWRKRLRSACLISLLLNAAVFAVNAQHYSKTYQLLLCRTVPGWPHPEQQAVGMRVNLNGYRGGGVLTYDFMLLVIPFLGCALLLFLLLSGVRAIIRAARGE